MNRRLVLGLAGVVVAVAVLWWLRRSPPAKPPAGPAATHGVAPPVLDVPPGERSAPTWFVQRGVKARRIAGYVRFAGAPAVGATVALQDQLTRSGVRAIEVTTGKDGAFDLGAHSAQRYLVVARAPGKTAAAVAVDLRDPTEKPAPDQLELELGACDNVLFGTVNDASGGVIAGAHLVRMEQGLPGAGADSDAKGHYELCVPPGRSPIEVVADGYGSVMAALSARGRHQHDFALSPEATITGTVIQLDDGAPVGGALVRLELGEGLRRGGGVSTIADATGQFRFAGVAAGPHRLSASAELLATTEPVNVTVEAGRSAEVTLRLRGVSRLSGVVVASGKPVAGVTITAGLGERSRQSAPAITQADGSFVLERVPRGPVAFDVEDHEVIKPKGITVNQPELSGLTIEVALEASIAGRILHKGAPVAGADVSAGGRRSFSEDVSAADGSYTLRGLAPGSYEVSANSDRLGASGLSASVTLSKGEQRAGVDVDLADAASIAGVVVEDSGAPVAGATVRFSHTERQDFGTDETGPDGSFRAASLAGEGSYRVIVSMGFGRSGRLQPADPAGFPEVQVPDRTSQVTGVRLVVHRGHNVIAGTVIDGAGAAVPDARVTASRSDGARGGGRFGAGGGGFGGFGGAGGGPPGFGGGGPAPTDLSAITGTDGAFTLSDLDDGTYTLQARAGDGSSATVPDVTAGTKDVKIALDAAGGIDGTLNGFKTPPDVVVSRADRPGGQNHPQADAQSFHARGLTAGTYTVSASNDSEGDSVKVNVQAGKIATVTLTSHGTAEVTVHVSDWKTHAPASGLSCQFVLGSGDQRGGQTVPGQAFTDDSGKFTELVPAGDAYVTCAGDERFATAVAKATLISGKPTTLEVLTVTRRPGGELANLGAQLDPSQAFVARVAGVRPGGAAGKAGLQPKDTVVSVDGAPVGALGRAAVEVLIRDRPAGAAVKLGVDRDGKPAEADVTLDPPGGR